MRLTLEMLCRSLRHEARRVCTDSRKVQPGDIFVALPTPSGPANPKPDESFKHVVEAFQKGASTLVCQPGQEIAATPYMGSETDKNEQVLVDNPRVALGEIAKALYGEPAFPLIGITGTNGKTTCAFMLEYLLNRHPLSKKGGGFYAPKTGLMGTIFYRWPNHSQEAPLTTPDCLTLHQSLHAMGEEKVGAAIMEVSSHALHQERVAGLAFSGALFTNLTQDHLDYHLDMEDYFSAKAALFRSLPFADKAMAINGDDACGRRLLEEFPSAYAYFLVKNGESPTFTHKGPTLTGTLRALSPEGFTLAVQHNKDGLRQNWEIKSPLVGEHNATNMLGVMAMALALGMKHSHLACLANFCGLPGRLERIAPESGRALFVDYAHTPDALSHAISSLRASGFKRIITVFGCGGDRDRKKRPLMGQVVMELSDIAVLTSDNPRTENPEQIMDDVAMPTAPNHYREADRKKAIALAFSLMQEGDALLVAGKGHENYQIIGTTRHHLSDAETLQEVALAAH